MLVVIGGGPAYGDYRTGRVFGTGHVVLSMLSGREDIGLSMSLDGKSAQYNLLCTPSSCDLKRQMIKNSRSAQGTCLIRGNSVFLVHQDFYFVNPSIPKLYNFFFAMNVCSGT